jgi:hypothetical protein
MFLPKTIGIRSTVGSQEPSDAGCKTENCEELAVLGKQDKLVCFVFVE